jgi:hypothetical protein
VVVTPSDPGANPVLAFVSETTLLKAVLKAVLKSVGAWPKPTNPSPVVPVRNPLLKPSSKLARVNCVPNGFVSPVVGRVAVAVDWVCVPKNGAIAASTFWKVVPNALATA